MIRSPRRLAATEVHVGGHMGKLIFFPFLGVTALAQTICSSTGARAAAAT